MIVDNDIDFRIGAEKLINSKDLNEETYKLLPNTEFIVNNTFCGGRISSFGRKRNKKDCGYDSKFYQSISIICLNFLFIPFSAIPITLI